MTELVTYLRGKQVVDVLTNKGLTETDSKNYIASALRLILGDAKLANCSKQSILNSLALCAEFKLSPEKSLDYSYFIPYGNDCKFMLGARGMKALLLREPSVTKLAIHLIKEGDTFHYSEDSEGGIHYKFEPKLFADKEAKVLGAVAYLEVKNGKGTRRHLTRMSKYEIDEIKAMSKSKNIWEKHYDEMAKKTVMRRLYKEVPTVFTDTNIDKAISFDDNEYNNIKEVKSENAEMENTNNTYSVSSDSLPKEDNNATLIDDLKSIDI
jgi:phage RecT family recombinase